MSWQKEDSEEAIASRRTAWKKHRKQLSSAVPPVPSTEEQGTEKQQQEDVEDLQARKVAWKARRRKTRGQGSIVNRENSQAARERSEDQESSAGVSNETMNTDTIETPAKIANKEEKDEIPTSTPTIDSDQTSSIQSLQPSSKLHTCTRQINLVFIFDVKNVVGPSKKISSDNESRESTVPSTQKEHSKIPPSQASIDAQESNSIQIPPTETPSEESQTISGNAAALHAAALITKQEWFKHGIQNLSNGVKRFKEAKRNEFESTLSAEAAEAFLRAQFFMEQAISTGEVKQSAALDEKMEQMSKKLRQLKKKAPAGALDAAYQAHEGFKKSQLRKGKIKSFMKDLKTAKIADPVPESTVPDQVPKPNLSAVEKAQEKVEEPVPINTELSAVSTNVPENHDKPQTDKVVNEVEVPKKSSQEDVPATGIMVPLSSSSNSEAVTTTNHENAHEKTSSKHSVLLKSPEDLNTTVDKKFGANTQIGKDALQEKQSSRRSASTAFSKDSQSANSDPKYVLQMF